MAHPGHRPPRRPTGLPAGRQRHPPTISTRGPPGAPGPAPAPSPPGPPPTPPDPVFSGVTSAQGGLPIAPAPPPDPPVQPLHRRTNRGLVERYPLNEDITAW